MLSRIKSRMASTRGFTLIELLVVIVIIGLLSAAAIPSFVRSVKKQRFLNTVNEVMTLFERARTQALASELNANQKIPPGGYGVFVDQTNEEVILFVDDWNESAGAAVNMDFINLAVSGSAALVAPDRDFTAGAGGDTVVDAVSFEGGGDIALTALSGTQLLTATTLDQDSVVSIFQPPYADVSSTGTASGLSAALKEFKIEFRLHSQNVSRELVFNTITTTPLILK